MLSVPYTCLSGKRSNAAQCLCNSKILFHDEKAQVKSANKSENKIVTGFCLSIKNFRGQN